MNKNLFGVIGTHLSESKNPFIQNSFARQKEKDVFYNKIVSTKEDFVDDVNHFFSRTGKGLNVAFPFKEDAYQLADQLTSRARIAKSVNTLAVLNNGHIIGDNTEGFGIVMDLKRLYVKLEGKRILIIGAGGITRGILKPILDENPLEIVMANRTYNKAVKVSNEFKLHGNIKAMEIKNINTPFDVIINATSGDAVHKLGLSNKIFQVNSFIYDITYKSKLTKFIKYAELNGCEDRTDGVGMLVFQGAESFNLWHEEFPDVAKIIKDLRCMVSSTR